MPGRNEVAATGNDSMGCGTCFHFKRTFPTSKRLESYGSCYWPLPKGVVLPSSFKRSGVEAHEGTHCRQWKMRIVT